MARYDSNEDFILESSNTFLEQSILTGKNIKRSSLNSNINDDDEAHEGAENDRE